MDAYVMFMPYIYFLQPLPILDLKTQNDANLQ